MQEKRTKIQFQATASDLNKRLHRHICLVLLNDRCEHERSTIRRCWLFSVGMRCVRKCVAIASVRTVGTHCAYGLGKCDAITIKKAYSFPPLHTRCSSIVWPLYKYQVTAKESGLYQIFGCRIIF